MNTFYIDSGKFMFDAVLLDEVNIPYNIGEIDMDTGEQLREFKRKSIHVPYNDYFEIKIARFPKVLNNITYDKFIMHFSAKISENYMNGIQINDVKNVLRLLRKKGYIKYQDINEEYIISQIFVKDIDIAYNIQIATDSMDSVIEAWKDIKSFAGRESIRVGNAKDNKMIQFNSRGHKYFFKGYNKTLETLKDKDKFNSINMSDEDRLMFLNKDIQVIRTEIKIRNTKAFYYGLSQFPSIRVGL